MDWAKFSHVYLPSRGRRFNDRRFESPGVNLKYNTLISEPARQVFPIEILKQWDGVLPGDPRKFFERANGEPGTAFFAILGEPLAQLCYGEFMENQVVRYFYKHFFAQQNLQNFLSAA